MFSIERGLILVAALARKPQPSPPPVPVAEAKRPVLRLVSTNPPARPQDHARSGEPRR